MEWLNNLEFLQKVSIIVLILESITNITQGSLSFRNTNPEPRCRKRGQYLTHPSDRCKYMVCEFETVSNAYGPTRMIATEMPCAPGTIVTLRSYMTRESLYGHPCAGVSKRCHPQQSFTRYRSNSYENSHGSDSTSNRFNSGTSGYQSQLASSGRNARFQRSKRRERTPSDSWNNVPSHANAFSSTRVVKTAEQVHFQRHFQDDRCTRLGEYLTHHENRCKYVVCEYSIDTMIGYGGYNNKMYAREMVCAPGTAVPENRYSQSGAGWSKSPCTDHYSGYCPGPLTGGGTAGGGYESIGSPQANAFHPLDRPSRESYNNFWS